MHVVSCKAATSAVLLDCKLSFVNKVGSEEPISAEIEQVSTKEARAS